MLNFYNYALIWLIAMPIFVKIILNVHVNYSYYKRHSFVSFVPALLTFVYFLSLVTTLILSNIYVGSFPRYHVEHYVTIVPGYAETAIFFLVPSLFFWNALRSTIPFLPSSLLYEITCDWFSFEVISFNLFSLRSGLVFMMVNCVMTISSLLSSAVFLNSKVVVRPWPYGLFTQHTIQYSSITKIVTSNTRYIGKFSGPPVPTFDFKIYSGEQFIWSTRWSGDGSIDSDRRLALSMIKSKCPHVFVVTDMPLFAR